MSNIPADLKYLDSHEWARVECDGTVTIGISDHAQGALGDIPSRTAPRNQFGTRRDQSDG